MRHLISTLALLGVAAGAAAQPPTAAEQIAAAVLPAPEAARAAATVLGYDAELALVTLRAGDGQLTCLADDPRDERFHVACYHESLEPFMARGRELRAEGKERDQVLAIREQEIADGRIVMPPGPAALYSLTAPAANWKAETGELVGANRVSVVYIPYATEESTGLPPEPVTPGGPWIMAPGKPWAHIMIVQAAEEPAAAD